MALVNDIVSRISRVAEAAGFRTDAIFVNDIRDAFRPGRVEIQAGRNELFEGSQIVDITIYDSDDLSVTIPTGVSEKFNVPINNAFRSVESVISFIQKFSQLIKSKATPEVEPEVGPEVEQLA
jgi:hypothetical protein